ncbi:hypothetical protein C3432_11700 [Citrobacter amalonaticus]|uniref:Uncharacterized protein n=1 Tax=Citrobacter amalonaticus TaxID=35703 RepID=A0A2S4RPV6_CITAM|nr:hypothetical protein C3432_11700 [Citrobacter amalonaticus]POT75935.1 hypothetical protein C3436_00115 [Citrobacter amalonaticus]POU59103.1 hypothetical protein C3430_26885 [Citrobacter amalonaticus]POV05170.1 hypothetical protein C3424_07420 [Citrobacter amalonaticus]
MPGVITPFGWYIHIETTKAGVQGDLQVGEDRLAMVTQGTGRRTVDFSDKPEVVEEPFTARERLTAADKEGARELCEIVFPYSSTGMNQVIVAVAVEVELVFQPGVGVEIIPHGRADHAQENPGPAVDSPVAGGIGEGDLLTFKVVKVVAGAVFGGEFFVNESHDVSSGREIYHYRNDRRRDLTEDV